MRHRARQIWATASNVEKAAGLGNRIEKQLDGQISFEEGENA